MKNILSFFIMLVSFNIFAWGSNDEHTTDYKVSTGIAINTKLLNIRVYHEKESIPDSIEELAPKTWFIGFTPFEFLTLKLGAISYSGIWSRFMSATPTKISPTKNSYSLQQRLISSPPTFSTPEKTPSISVVFSFPLFKLEGFISTQEQQDFFSGAGIFFPFNLKQNSIQGNWSFAWRMGSIHPKPANTWFLNNAYFIEDIFHSFIQELSIKNTTQFFQLALGITQSPQGSPSGFLRSEFTITNNLFLLNAQLFLCDKNYLGQNGDTQKKTIMLGINPQIRLIYYSGLIRSIKVGLTTSAELHKAKKYGENMNWYVHFNIASDIRLVFGSLINSLSIENLLADRNDNTLFILDSQEAVLKVQSKINFFPWYFDLLKREWTIESSYEGKISDLKNTDSISLKTAVQIHMPLFQIQEMRLYLSGERKIVLAKETSLSPITFDIGLKCEASAEIFQHKHTISISAVVQNEITNNKNHITKAEISALVRL